MEYQGRSDNTKAILAQLSDWDARCRHEAREQLVHLGEMALPLLLDKLQAQDWRVRWEAVKALGEIGDPIAIDPLVKMLQDDHTGVRWAAMGSLIRFSRASIRPMLLALTYEFTSARLREGVHHVLHILHGQHKLSGMEEAVFRALEGRSAGVIAAQAANRALIVEYSRKA